MLAFWGKRRIEKRGYGDVKIRRGGEFSVFRSVEGPLEIIDLWTDMNPAGEGVEKSFDGIESRKFGESSKSEMNLRDGSRGANVANAQSECRIELGGIEQFEKSPLGIDTGDNGLDGDFFAIGEYESHDGAVFRADVLNLS